MKLSAEITIRIKREHFPNLVYEMYKHDCEIHRLDLTDSENGEDIYSAEIVYYSREKFIALTGILARNSDKYTLLSQTNSMEQNIRGGMLTVKGKSDIENTNDYHMNILGAAVLMKEKIRAGWGDQFSGINLNAAEICCINAPDEPDRTEVMDLYADAEKESVILNRFTGMNGIPLIIRYSNQDDLVKTLCRIEPSFAAVRMVASGTRDHTIIDQISDCIGISFLSRDYDELPLYLLSLVITMVKKHELNPADTTVGFIGVNSSSLRSARLLNSLGFFKVLGFDHDEKSMMDFENFGGLATTSDNILLNSDILFLMNDRLGEDDLEKLRPGQYIITLADSSAAAIKIISARGAREIVAVDMDSLDYIHPGLLRGMVNSRQKTLSDTALIYAARKISLMMNVDFSLPDIFSDIHEKISGIISESK